MRQVILVLTGILLLTGCTTVVDSVTSEPIKTDPADTSAGTYYNDRKMATFIGVNIKKEIGRAHV